MCPFFFFLNLFWGTGRHTDQSGWEIVRVFWGFLLTLLVSGSQLVSSVSSATASVSCLCVIVSLYAVIVSVSCLCVTVSLYASIVSVCCLFVVTLQTCYFEVVSLKS